MSILVVGSLGLDHTFFVSKLPGKGQTVMARDTLQSFGGKGANQAFAAKRAGGNVSFVGSVGDDWEGRAYRKHFTDEGILADGMVVNSGAATGSAILGVEDSGENLIIINPGANHALGPGHLDEHRHLFETAEILLLQLEIPMETTAYACRLAREHDLKTIINPSPWSEEFNTRNFPCDVLIVNELEMTSLAGRENWKLDAEILKELNLETLIVTQGPKPTLAIDGKGRLLECKPPSVTPVDTVGAGDTFAGAFAVAASEGMSLERAIHFANRAASLSVLKAGAQGATPHRSEIDLVGSDS